MVLAIIINLGLCVLIGALFGPWWGVAAFLVSGLIGHLGQDAA